VDHLPTDNCGRQFRCKKIRSFFCLGSKYDKIWRFFVWGQNTTKSGDFLSGVKIRQIFCLGSKYDKIWRFFVWGQNTTKSGDFFVAEKEALRRQGRINLTSALFTAARID
jgi:hypothetical protein